MKSFRSAACYESVILRPAFGRRTSRNAQSLMAYRGFHTRVWVKSRASVSKFESIPGGPSAKSGPQDDSQ